MATSAAIAALPARAAGHVEAPACEALRPAAAVAGHGGESADQAPRLDIEDLTVRAPGGDSVREGWRGEVRGAVTLVVSDGFYLQDPWAAPVASRPGPAAVFVFTGRERPAVSAGDAVRLEATVSSWHGPRRGRGRPAHGRDAGNGAAEPATGAEDPPSGANDASPSPPRPRFTGEDAGPGPLSRHPVVELVGVRGLRVLGRDCAPAPVALPWPPDDDALPARLEGMRVRLVGTFTVQDAHLLAPWGQLLLATGGRQRAPADVLPPGPAAAAMAAREARARLLLDDGADTAWPAPVPFWQPDGTGRAGDTVEGLDGVLDTGTTGARVEGPRAWRLRPAGPVRFTRSNPRPPHPPEVGGDARVASANVDNFFVSPADGRTGCAPSGRLSDCRGARDPVAYERQLAKLATMLAGLDADVLALMELQGPDDRAAQALAQALDRRTGRPVWAVVAGAPGGRDAIRVGLLYRTDRVRPVGAPQADAAPVHGRAPLAQVFEWPGGGRVAVVAVHLKSKRCGPATGGAAAPGPDDEDRGDGAACFDGRRQAQARAVSRFAEAFARDHGGVGTLLVGDFNAYTRERPLEVLRAAGWVEAPMGRDAGAPFPYSFVHDGLAGSLDHAFASAALAGRVTGAAHWHVDADEPDFLDARLDHRAPGCARCAPDAFDPSVPARASDHDPLLIGLRPGRGAEGGRRQ